MHRAVVWTIALAFTVCGCSDISFDINRYKQAVKSGFKLIPQSMQIEELFGEADHFIGYHGSRSIPQTWNTEVWFEGRYELTMQVDVRVDQRFRKIEAVLGKPKFYFKEIESVSTDENGVVNGSNYSPNQLTFGDEEWQKVVAAKGDFGVIGIPIKRGQPVDHINEYIARIREPRVRVRPD